MSDSQPRLVLLGKQGAGKGTQAARIAGYYTINHVSTGDMFRAQAALGTEFGIEARRFMDSGNLVPDEIVMGVIAECLETGGTLEHGFVLDGFPRTLRQAQELDRLLGDDPLDLVVNLDVPREIVLDRLAGRRVCEECQRVYHVNLPPAHDWHCDNCGGRVIQRPDDTEEAIDRRLALYETETVPILDFYRERGQLVTVDGVGDGEDVFEHLVKVIDARTGF